MKLALELDPALVLFDDSIDGGQAQTRAFANFLGCEKWLKDPSQVLGRNTTAGVRRREADKPAWSRLRMLGDIGFGQILHRNPDAELAPGGHRVAGVDSEVQNDLLHHARVGV